MALELLRGHVKDLTSPDKRGDVDCQFGKYNIKVAGDLVSSMGKGDDLLLACIQRHDRYHALAVKNIDNGKAAQIDLTNSVLLFLASGFVCFFGFILGMQAEGRDIYIQSGSYVMGFIGLIGILKTFRRLFLITKAGSWVRHANISREA